MTNRELKKKLENDAYRFGYEYAVGTMEGFISRIDCCETTWEEYCYGKENYWLYQAAASCR